MKHTRFARLAVALMALVVSMPAGTVAQGPTGTWEWRTYGGDLASTRYAPLDQIDQDNFAELEVAWRFKTDALGPRPEYNLQSTPLMVGGVLYSTAGTRRAVVALDAATGELLWVHSLNEGQRGESAPRLLSGRGLSYWSDGREARIIYVTPGYQMVALDAKTGARVAGFGKNGIVDLKQDFDQQIDMNNAPVGLHAAPVIARDVVIIGAAFETGPIQRARATSRATFAASTSARVSVYGSSTRFHDPVSSGTTRGAASPPPTPETPAYGLK